MIESFIAAEDAPALVDHVDCAVVMVTYNSADHIERALDSLPAAAESLAIRCIVVDNGSTDGTRDLVRARSDAILVESESNLGYGGGFNLGRSYAGPCSSVVILNPDLVLDPGALARLFAAVQEPGVGVAVPLLLNYDGTLYRSLRREPSIARAFVDGLLGSRFAGRPAWLTETLHDSAGYGQPRDVDWAAGAAILISEACNDAVGPWDDERFFLYSEETDFSRRARQEGYRIRFVPSARARHEEGGSGQSPALAALLAVNRVRYFEKYHARSAAWLFRAAVTVNYLVRARRVDNRAALKALLRRSSWDRLPKRDWRGAAAAVGTRTKG